MAWTAADIPNLEGRVVVVTGTNTGLGLQSAAALAGAGAHVVMAARTRSKNEAAQSQILGTNPSASLELVDLDLASQKSIRSAAETIAANHPKIDILLNNAGLMACPERRTEDGFEMQLGVNHLGPWALTSHLLPNLLRAEAARVVAVTSTARHMGRAINPDNPNLEGSYEAWKAYGQSKLANFHFALGLQRLFRAAGLNAASLVAHPGLSDTNLQAVSVEESEGGLSQRFFHVLAGRTGMTAEAGARPQLRAATDPNAKGGQLYAPRFANNGAAVSRPIFRRLGLSSGIAKLWQVSEKMTGLTVDPAAVAAKLS
ncbi:MAG: NAD(P)-dependent dehydrogenase (short-subunit alcohol dehydrogenase family) [Hyphomicrobiaceae bacterium]|jgi:NAD(P)-dependent dehydrogenase (short-subunit alcohol dehydrogenase family)